MKIILGFVGTVFAVEQGIYESVGDYEVDEAVGWQEGKCMPMRNVPTVPFELDMIYNVPIYDLYTTDM